MHYYTRFRQGHFSFLCLNIAQFLGALNDNIYKLLVIFFLLRIEGSAHAGRIVAMAGALYVTPFLLFSSGAGILADRFRKSKIIQWLKGVEIGILCLALFAFLTQSAFVCYILLFLLASHSAIFGPSKYGIIPEIVDKKQISKANGQLTSMTYLAVILGTFLASFLTEMTDGNFSLAVSVCFVFAILGFVITFGIKTTPIARSRQKARILFLAEIAHTLQEARSIPSLIPALFGSAYFLFLGAFTQLNVIPFAIESLHRSEYAGGYLFLLTALGIVFGSWITSRFLKNKLQIALSSLLIGGLALLYTLLWLFNIFLLPTLFVLFGIGMLGGMFVVTCDTFIQVHSPAMHRGQIIGAANFLSFFGVLIASGLLFLFHGMGLHASTSFLIIAFFTACTTLFVSLQLLDTLMPLLGTIIKKRFPVHDPLELQRQSHIFLLQRPHIALLWTSCIQSSRIVFLIQAIPNTPLLWLLHFSPHVFMVSPELSWSDLLRKAKSLEDGECTVCLMTKMPLPSKKGFHPLQLLVPRESVCMLSLHAQGVLIEKIEIS